MSYKRIQCVTELPDVVMLGAQEGSDKQSMTKDNFKKDL